MSVQLSPMEIQFLPTSRMPQMSKIMNFKWKLGETFRNDWTWDEVQTCNPKATSWNWERIREGQLYPLPPQCVKILILGSPCVGKSTLLWSFFDDCDGPTVPITACYENCELHLHNMKENGADVMVYFCDISGVDNLLELQPDVLRDTHVIIYCYDVNNGQSVYDLVGSWIPLSRLFLNVPSILVGNMVDIRDNADPNDLEFVLSYEEGQYIKDIWGINRFYECSIEDGETPTIIFQTALRLALKLEI